MLAHAQPQVQPLRFRAHDCYHGDGHVTLIAGDRTSVNFYPALSRHSVRRHVTEVHIDWLATPEPLPDEYDAGRATA